MNDTDLTPGVEAGIVATPVRQMRPEGIHLATGSPFGKATVPVANVRLGDAGAFSPLGNLGLACRVGLWFTGETEMALVGSSRLPNGWRLGKSRP